MSDETPEAAHHDMGGIKQFYCDTIDRSDHELSEFDRRVDALRQQLAFRGLMTVDELRRNIEAMPPELYDRLSYYQRWMRAIAGALVNRGVISQQELDERLRALSA